MKGTNIHIDTFDNLHYDLFKQDQMYLFDDDELLRYLCVILYRGRIYKHYSVEVVNKTLKELCNRNVLYHFYTDGCYVLRRKQANAYIRKPEVRKEVFRLHGYRCLNCPRKTNIHLDHVKPVILGGLDTIDNLQPLCYKCNISKGAKTIDYRI